MIDPSIETKRREAAAARQELLATAQTLQARLKPAVLAEHAADRLRRQSEHAASGLVEAVRRRPVAVIAATAGLVALLSAGSIGRLTRRLRHKDQAGAQRPRGRGRRAAP